MSRVIVFGIDGCTYDVVKRVAPESKFFSTLLAESQHGLLETVPPATTAIGWTAFFTGKNPGKTGNLTMSYKECLLESFARGLRGVHGDALWDIVGREGMKTLSFNLSISYPAKEINGVMISSFDSVGDDWCYPKSLQSAISKIWEPVEKTISDYNDIAPYLYYLLERIDAEERLVSSLLNSLDWDLGIITFLEADRIQHTCLNSKELIKNIVVDTVYKRIGLACQRVWEKYSDAHIFVACDHGMRETDRGFFINSWMYRRGHLYQKKGTVPLFDKYTGAVLPLTDVDFSRTKAWSAGLGTITINDRRFHGVVNDPENFTEQLRKKLCDVIEPETGEPVFEKILTREEAWSGDFIDDMPDLVALPNGRARCEAHWTQTSPTPFVYNTGRADHDIYSGFYATTAGEPGEINSHILNIAPSVLKCLGIKIPGDFDMKPLNCK